MSNILDLKVPPVVIFILAGIAGWYCHTQAYWPMPSPLPWLGIAIVVIGVLTGLAGVAAFRAHKTTVNPHRPQNTSSLVDTGIFRYSRNPMYLGLVLGIIGMAFYLGENSILLVAAVQAAYLQLFQILPEERAMQAQFGNEFTQYCQRTGRWLGARDN